MKTKESISKYLPIAVPYMDKEEVEAVKEVLLSGWITQGPKIVEFEKNFKEYINAKYAFAVTSCTTALHLALAAVGVNKGDYVIVPSFTWVSTANAVEYCGAIPLFCDCDIKTYNIDVNSLEKLIKDYIKRGIHPKAIIPVHLFGLCSDMDSIMNIAYKYNIKIVEDAACAVGAMYKGRYAGTIGDVGCFSFHPRKIISTGEGGMCITNDNNISEVIKALRNNGASISEEKRHMSNKPYIMPEFNVLGYNYRMTDIQGAIGIAQLKKLNGFIEKRRVWADYYKKELENIQWLNIPYVPQCCEQSWQSYVCRVDETKCNITRNEIMDKLQQMGIASRPGTLAVHELGYYANKYSINKEDYPVSAELYRTTISIPMHNKMIEEDYKRVVRALKEI